MVLSRDARLWLFLRWLEAKGMDARVLIGLDSEEWVDSGDVALQL